MMRLGSINMRLGSIREREGDGIQLRELNQKLVSGFAKMGDGTLDMTKKLTTGFKNMLN